MTETPAHYQQNNGKDLIAEWQEDGSPEENRAILRFSMQKYLKRYGKKDDPVIEAKKIKQYADRLYEYELSLSKGLTPEEASERYFGEV